MRNTAAMIVAALSLAPVAMAQADGWKATCQADRMTDKALCGLSKTVWPSVEKPYLMLMFSYADGIFAVGSREPGAKARIRVDKNVAIEAAFCGRSACELDLASSVELADQLSRGKVALVELRTSAGQVIGPYEFDTAGFLAEFMRGKEMAKQ